MDSKIEMDALKTLGRGKRVRPGPVSAAEADKRSKLIIAVAADEFLANGFEGATLASIARRCRISKTTLYGLFESKEALFMHVATAAIGEFSYNIQKLLDPQRPTVDVITDVVRLMVDTSSVGTSNSLTKLIIAEGDRFPILGRFTLDRTYDLLVPLSDYLEKMSGKKGLTKDQAHRWAYHLTSMAIGGYGQLLIKPSALYRDRAAWVESVVQVFMGGFNSLNGVRS